MTKGWANFTAALRKYVDWSIIAKGSRAQGAALEKVAEAGFLAEGCAYVAAFNASFKIDFCNPLTAASIHVGRSVRAYCPVTCAICRDGSAHDDCPEACGRGRREAGAEPLFG